MRELIISMKRQEQKLETLSESLNHKLVQLSDLRLTEQLNNNFHSK